MNTFKELYADWINQIQSILDGNVDTSYPHFRTDFIGSNMGLLEPHVSIFDNNIFVADYDKEKSPLGFWQKTTLTSYPSKDTAKGFTYYSPQCNYFGLTWVAEYGQRQPHNSVVYISCVQVPNLEICILEEGHGEFASMQRAPVIHLHPDMMRAIIDDMRHELGGQVTPVYTLPPFPCPSEGQIENWKKFVG
jgi:hypothetical protein